MRISRRSPGSSAEYKANTRKTCSRSAEVTQRAGDGERLADFGNLESGGANVEQQSLRPLVVNRRGEVERNRTVFARQGGYEPQNEQFAMVFRQSQQQAGGVRSDILSIDVRHQSNQPFRSPGHGRIQPQRCHRLSRRQQAVPRGERQEIRRNVAVDVGNGAQTESTSSLAAQPDLGLTKTGVVSSMDFQHGLHAAHVRSEILHGRPRTSPERGANRSQPS